MNDTGAVSNASSILDQFRNQTPQSGQGQGTDELGRSEFMDLMLAQMKNQNPLEPQKNGEFIAQLAQFSSLEQMESVSSSVEQLAGEFRSTQALQASAMVGQSVLVPSQSGQLGPDGKMDGVVNVPASTSSLRLTVVDESGAQVRQLDLGSAQAGQTTFEWDGKDGDGNAMPPGAYAIKAEASYPQGTQQLSTMINANVDSVSLGQKGGKGVTLNLAGMGQVALSDVQQIK
ncbi:flagellar basal-body rod modification protein FlgD [Tamilnaduibacter salinus]|uniref:Basal-body rod modification protein FlgD n=1 Tax=Tamilnaduibacter salinus TaxID=1484056 RepID=A0A2A2I519_9GAMM|nr:flagellar hook assembly protein FlgD [Tamilnaduibacter salinus]PAV26220.1 flagellar biosynthesis protein FlgD [Tamilnaduibacter salinus]PVY75293.1 flagellar basal-body rod modification protein FlgD [Tamilnaduibacter salinus]